MDVFNVEVAWIGEDSQRRVVVADAPFLSGLAATPAKMIIFRDGGGDEKGERV